MTLSTRHHRQHGPEYGATCGYFPIDAETLRYLAEPERVALVEAYARAQGLFRESATPALVFSDTLALDLDSVEPSLAEPKRPQDRVLRSEKRFVAALDSEFKKGDEVAKRVPVASISGTATR